MAWVRLPCMMRPERGQVTGTTRCAFGPLELGDLEDEWSRGENGDVRNLRAFNRHMATVGEEDQSQPGWDFLP